MTRLNGSLVLTFCKAGKHSWAVVLWYILASSEISREICFSFIRVIIQSSSIHCGENDKKKSFLNFVWNQTDMFEKMYLVILQYRLTGMYLCTSFTGKKCVLVAEIGVSKHCAGYLITPKKGFQLYL